MINFRFHLVSLVAVFLALTVGIIVGATIVNQAIVHDLNSRIDGVEKNADAQRNENKTLSAAAKQTDAYLEAAAPFVVEGRLTGVPVVVLAERGVDRDTVRNLVTLVQDAGAQAPAIVWLESKWRLDQAGDRAKLATIVGDAPTSASLRVDALVALASRLGTPAKTRSPTTTAAVTTTTVAVPDLLDALSTAGFVSVDPVGPSGTNDLSTFPGVGARAIVVGGEASALATTPLVAPVATAFSDLDVATVAGEVFHAGAANQARGVVVGPIRDGSLDRVVSTVDDVDLVQGQVASVLAIAQAGEGKVGHYGYGRGANDAMPVWSGP